MTTRTEEPVAGEHSTVDSIFRLVEAHGDGVAMTMLWLVPALALLIAILRP